MPRREGGNPRGKLKAAARAWATGRGGGKRADNDALTAASVLPDWARSSGTAEAPAEIWPDMVDAVALFVALGTQWNWHPVAGVRLGIRYEAVAPAAAAMELTLTPAIFNDLRLMEAEAIAASVSRK